MLKVKQERRELRPCEGMNIEETTRAKPEIFLNTNKKYHIEKTPQKKLILNHIVIINQYDRVEIQHSDIINKHG